MHAIFEFDTTTPSTRRLLQDPQRRFPAWLATHVAQHVEDLAEHLGEPTHHNVWLVLLTPRGQVCTWHKGDPNLRNAACRAEVQYDTTADEPLTVRLGWHVSLPKPNPALLERANRALEAELATALADDEALQSHVQDLQRDKAQLTALVEQLQAQLTETQARLADAETIIANVGDGPGAMLVES